MRKISIIFASILLLIISACSAESSKDSQKTEPIIDATKFSRISSAQLIEIMGEPEYVDEYNWLVPSTGKEIPAKTYIYEGNKYEFMVIEDAVTRMSIYSGTYMGYDDTSFEFKNDEDLFSMFNIQPSDDLKKVADTGAALRFTPVSEKVAELWVLEIEKNNFGIAKITYNLNYY
ncbi:hypothetical protein AEA09_07245 [Lysinibacillus contaminans]|uniref:Uncharacterized protein n=1 Tax=Lysinibacillus contaminans TaxID=1293441 RepID=A0ABR5K0V8_9BACI|nr:hypothetical protein [Lysinibacillus contaminans]KOS68371.1 hypothetical protein AEA09_07245 [Lysinibacillus contaminans]